jgi:aryl-alcohol dehydrogenase-like predicted oxidoreductase
VARRLAEIATTLDVTPTTLAVSWVLHQPLVSSVIFGASTVEQIDATLAAADLDLTPDQLAATTACAEET